MGPDAVSNPESTGVFPSPKERIRPVYLVPEGPVARTQNVVYQLEDTGHPLLRLRVSVRLVESPTGPPSVLYRVDAHSRVTGAWLGSAETIAESGSAAEYAAIARQFQSDPFRTVVQALRDDVAERFRDSVPQEAVQV